MRICFLFFIFLQELERPARGVSRRTYKIIRVSREGVLRLRRDLSGLFRREKFGAKAFRRT